MPFDTQPIILIPARMSSSRFPGKVLADVLGKPMIVRVMEQAKKADIGPVYVACSEPEVEDVIKQYGGQAIMTDPHLPSGTDRIHAALQQIDPGQEFQHVINLQGDLPFLDPALIVELEDMMEAAPEADVVTLATLITDESERSNPHIVKAIIAVFEEDKQHGRALYFTRATPYGDGPAYHHIGLYGYERHALERFVMFPPTPLEKQEKLEQLRALEHQMHIQVGITDTFPLGVDTPEDLERVCQHINNSIEA